MNKRQKNLSPLATKILVTISTTLNRCIFLYIFKNKATLRPLLRYILDRYYIPYFPKSPPNPKPIAKSPTFDKKTSLTSSPLLPKEDWKNKNFFVFKIKFTS